MKKNKITNVSLSVMKFQTEKAPFRIPNNFTVINTEPFKSQIQKRVY